FVLLEVVQVRRDHAEGLAQLVGQRVGAGGLLRVGRRGEQARTQPLLALGFDLPGDAVEVGEQVSHWFPLPWRGTASPMRRSGPPRTWRGRRRGPARVRWPIPRG